ncbi:MAG: hypothetical protein AAGA48_38775 [Myxococcota bacterium]
MRLVAFALLACTAARPTLASPPNPQVAPTRTRPIHVEEITRLDVSQPFAFQADTSILLPESLSLVKEVANYLNQRAEIRLAKILVFTSDDDFDRSYLPDARARAVYEALMEHGVPQARLAYGGGMDTSCIQHRYPQRIEIHLERFGRTEPLPGPCAEGEPPEGCYPTTQQLPWNGKWVDVVIPSLAHLGE